MTSVSTNYRGKRSLGGGLLRATLNFCIYLLGATVQSMKYVPFIFNLSCSVYSAEFSYSNTMAIKWIKSYSGVSLC